MSLQQKSTISQNSRKCQKCGQLVDAAESTCPSCGDVYWGGIKGLFGGAILMFAILTVVSYFAFTSHSIFWIVITIIFDLFLGGIGTIMTLTLWKQIDKIRAQRKIPRANIDVLLPDAISLRTCKKCRRETGHGRIYQYYYGYELGAHSYHHGNQITMVENYRIDGSNQGFLCHKCILSGYYQKERTTYYSFMVLLTLGIGVFYTWLAWQEGFDILTLPYLIATIIVVNGIIYFSKASNDKKIWAVEHDDENFMGAAVAKNEKETSSYREIQRRGDIVLMEILNPDLVFSPDTAASLRCQGQKIEGKLIPATVNVYYITQSLYDDFKQLGKIK